MTEHRSAVATGAILTLIAVAWCAYVWNTIPPGAGGADVGPRAFPLLLGAILGVLAAGYAVANALAAKRSPNTVSATEPKDTSSHGKEFPMMVLTFLLLVIYGFAMPRIGFVLATALTVFLGVVVVVRSRSLPLIILMPLGVTFGCWLVFGKIMDIPLAVGRWISLG
ncbi:tripartite tricarboxylate transporter TctB family protein [Notoacmeibacter sp. MSK16QG-6]|uniref:tripartite tricarboxylate transporter TctB family protein n=1 Tax=Notoacmeibacter sp. MSK16QG-6 TaxID=2957982 RepID=UPI0020A18441|nr:tripartite tricarboxylate transporter TctB family protein [Notoacmeibacter sp. MSK16QG-6]MCP1200450.1 tripartite tricarboxylate transporter TctB family protein [Notoacmeibacter sp. MSK16QG-6]